MRPSIRPRQQHSPRGQDEEGAVISKWGGASAPLKFSLSECFLLVIKLLSEIQTWGQKSPILGNLGVLEAQLNFAHSAKNLHLFVRKF